MMKKEKTIIVLGIIVFSISIGVIFLWKNQASNQNHIKEKIITNIIMGDGFETAIVSNNSSFFQQEPVIITACSTFHYMLEKLEKNFSHNQLTTIKVETTAEGLRLLKQNQTDLVIAGRATKPEESDFLFKKIGPGYDFVFTKEIFILESEMASVIFYTDLPIDKVINDFPFLSKNNLRELENLYHSADQGIIITSSKNTIEKEQVHIFKTDGSRVRLSRTPRLYYLPDFAEETIEIIAEVIKENDLSIEIIN